MIYDKDYVNGGIWGLIVGDALGLPFEFKSPYYMKEHPAISMVGGGTWNQPVGTWSDDSGLTLATMGAIIKNKGSIDYDKIMKEFVRWAVRGEYTQNPGHPPFDYGNTTIKGINNYINGFSVFESGLKGEENNGNGSLMRILPLAFTNSNYKDIEMVSSLTHAHPRSKIGCVLYCEICRQIMKGGKSTFCDYVNKAGTIIQRYYEDNPELDYYQRIFDNDFEEGVTGGMYIVDTLESAIYSIKYSDDFESSLLMAVNLGGDTDTVGAVCGGLAGIYYGFDDIPKEWLSSIYNSEIVDELIENYCDVL